MMEGNLTYTSVDMARSKLDWPYDLVIGEQERENSKVILDVPFLVDLLHERKAAHCMQFDLNENGATLCATEMSINLLLEGAYLAYNSDANILELQESLTLLPMTRRAIRFLCAISAHLASQGKSMRYFDTVTAAIALDNNGAIITRGRHFDLVPTLMVVNY
jgi:predicted nucleic acid-binding protein